MGFQLGDGLLLQFRLGLQLVVDFFVVLLQFVVDRLLLGQQLREPLLVFRSGFGIVDLQPPILVGVIDHHGKRHEHKAHDEDEDGKDFADEVHS